MAEEFDSSPPPADQAPAALTVADSVADEPVSEAGNFLDLLDRLLQEEAIARDPASASYLRRFLEDLHIDEELGAGTGPSTARARSPEGAELAAAERTRLRRATAQAKVADEQQFLCDRMAAQAEPWISARAVMRVGADLSTSREALLRTAGLCFLQGRYDEAARAVNSLAKMGVELSSSELELFDQINRSVLQKIKDEAAIKRAENCNVEIDEQIVNLIVEVVELIDNCLLPFCPIEDGVLYNTMKGDLLAFLAETYDSGEYRSAATFAYEESFQAAVETCDALHPSRLRAAFDLASFLDKSKSSLRGYSIASQAVLDIENSLKHAKKCNCSAELKSSLFLLNNLKEQLHIKLSGRKGLLPYPEMVPMKALEEEDLEVYRLANTASEEDNQANRRHQHPLSKERKT